MTRHGGTNTFDTSDVVHTVDKLDDVLDVAGEVLFEYGGYPGDTRIERLARYVVATLGGEPYGIQRLGTHARCKLDHDGLEVLRADERFGIVQGGLTLIIGNTAREAVSLAVAILRTAELLEQE